MFLREGNVYQDSTVGGRAAAHLALETGCKRAVGGHGDIPCGPGVWASLHAVAVPVAADATVRGLEEGGCRCRLCPIPKRLYNFRRRVLHHGVHPLFEQLEEDSVCGGSRAVQAQIYAQSALGSVMGNSRQGKNAGPMCAKAFSLYWLA